MHRKKGVNAPTSIAIAPHHSWCDAILVSSSINTRITCARGGTSICNPFSTHNRTTMIIYVRRKIIHSAGNINKLAIAQALAHFFNRAMNVPEMRFNFFYRFAVQRNEQMQHSMRCRMLRPHIDHKITFHIR